MHPQNDQLQQWNRVVMWIDRLVVVYQRCIQGYNAEAHFKALLSASTCNLHVLRMSTAFVFLIL